jgi:hypothetical protein
MLEGDAAPTATVPAAFKAVTVRSTAGGQFNYGLDLINQPGPSQPTVAIADIRLSAGPLIYSGNGAPAAGLCAAPTLGSVYLNLAGGVGTSLYVCEVAGAWAGK